MEDKDIRVICQQHQVECNRITKAIGSFEKELFFIDDKYLIRTSSQPMLDELNKIKRIKDLEHVPKVAATSDKNSSASNIFYLILSYIKGSELLEVYNELKTQDIHAIATEIVDFLSGLHQIKGEKYDIGHYIPIIPNYDKSWRSGHEQYWGYIYQELKNIQLSNTFQQALEQGNDYIAKNISCMEYENGPSLLHNDFHFKNIIIHHTTFSGVIDWECSQFGEPDFDLIHLAHWCLFPPAKDLDLKQLFDTVFLLYRKKCNIPMLEKRLTIYLIEHDFIQVLWSNGKRENEFLSRIEYWVSGGLEKYIQNIKENS